MCDVLSEGDRDGQRQVQVEFIQTEILLLSRLLSCSDPLHHEEHRMLRDDPFIV